MRILTIVLISIVFSPLTEFSYAQEVVEEVNMSESGDGNYYLVFMARGPVPPGHAFVMWGREDDEKQMSTFKAFGLYPDSDNELKIVFGEVPGEIKDEWQSDKMSDITHRLIVKVNKAAYQKSLQVKRKWETNFQETEISTNTYELIKKDCVTFASDIARSIGLLIPDRNLSTYLPEDFIRALIDIN